MRGLWEAGTMTRIFIVDDHAIVREGLKQLFALVDDIVVAGEAENGEQAIRRLSRDNIDLLLLDMSMPGMNGSELIRRLRLRHAGIPILVLSMHVEPQIAQSAFAAGAMGYAIKDLAPEILLDAIRSIATGGRFVDPRLADSLNLKHLGISAS
jgi:DNA-binding NarL/FixJ family response regulator